MRDNIKEYVVYLQMVVAVMPAWLKETLFLKGMQRL